MRDHTHKSLHASYQVLKQERQARLVSQALSLSGALIGVFCIIFATHVALN